MVQEEYLNDNTLIHHYSDNGKMLIQNETGIEYPDAIDVVPCQYTYSESENPIPNYDITGEEFLKMLEGVM